MIEPHFDVKFEPREQGERHDRLVVGDTVYEITPAYREGAKAMRDEIPWNRNPYRDGSQRHDDWNYGHENESEGYHQGIELERPRAGRPTRACPAVAQSSERATARQAC